MTLHKISCLITSKSFFLFSSTFSLFLSQHLYNIFIPPLRVASSILWAPLLYPMVNEYWQLSFLNSFMKLQNYMWLKIITKKLTKHLLYIKRWPFKLLLWYLKMTSLKNIQFKLTKIYENITKQNNKNKSEDNNGKIKQKLQCS